MTNIRKNISRSYIKTCKSTPIAFANVSEKARSTATRNTEALQCWKEINSTSSVTLFPQKYKVNYFCFPFNNKKYIKKCGKSVKKSINRYSSVNKSN